MNEYLMALIGLLAIFVVGVLCYGVLFKGFIGENAVKLTPTRFAIAGVGMYVIAWIFIMLFKNYDAGDVSNVMKGFQLGLMVGVGFFMIPLFADAGYFKSKMNLEWAIIANWVASFAVLGIVIGWLMDM
ncbi:hypothetical protein BH11PAT4_BH11PAT4_4330 [soil metagenome]